MKKKLLCLITFIVANLFILSVDAGQATLVGRNYGSGQINTSIDVSNAHLKLYPLKYTMTESTNPTISWVKGTNGSIKRMESDIVFFSGHGNSSLMHFYNTDSSDSNYDFYIKASSNTSNTVGLNSYNMSKVKLLVFAGCETANGTTNITKSAYDLGAKGSLGWTTSIGASSHTQWLNKFWERIGTGGSLSQAVDQANKGSYTDSRVKNTKYYGGTYSGLSLPYELLRRSSFTNNYESNNEYELNVVLKELDIKSEISKAIKTNINSNFNIGQFYVATSESNDITIYDFQYLINGNIRTTLGYTIFIKDNKIINVIDNTKNKNYESIKNSIISLNNNVYPIDLDKQLSNNEYIYYDDVDNIIYKVIMENIVNLDGTISVNEQFIELIK